VSLKEWDGQIRFGTGRRTIDVLNQVVKQVPAAWYVLTTNGDPARVEQVGFGSATGSAFPL
jgi:hypothetical protein